MKRLDDAVVAVVGAAERGTGEGENVPRVSNRIRHAKIQREAEGYLELGMARQALGALGRLGDPTALDAHSLYLWGEALRELERYEEALVPLERAAEIVPDQIPIWIALGWCYKRIGRLDLAIESLETAVAIEPSTALLHYNLACYWSLAGNKERLLQSLSRTLSIDADFRKLIDDEPDFDPFRSDPDFRSLCEGEPSQR
jgi:tetratricopeptide (TPR) repeat protein